MDIMVLNDKFESMFILDTFKSSIWTDRYCAYGDFEIYTPATYESFMRLQLGNYLCQRESEHSMIVESVDITSDSEYGDYIIATGRSLESILTRRIVWKTFTISGSVQDGIEQMLNDAFIAPTDADRKVSNFQFVRSTDPDVLGVTIEKQIGRGSNVYDVVVEICSLSNLGFKMTLDANGTISFSLYSGKDRSYDQLTNPYVVFSPEFENIINSRYTDSDKDYKTIDMVAGEGEGDSRVVELVTVPDGAGQGLKRRETYTDARHIRKEDGPDYSALLRQKGLEDLSEKSAYRAFDGEVDTVNSFQYDKDFFMGDIVQVANEYGATAKSRVVEFIFSQDEDGSKAYPTFEILE